MVRVRLTDEDAPDEQVLRRIEAIERARAVEGAEREAFLAALHPDARRLVEPACGLDEDRLAELYQILLPGRTHGYLPVRRPPTPTAARPGTEAKLRVMAERAELGVSLFHRDDARLEDA